MSLDERVFEAWHLQSEQRAADGSHRGPRLFDSVVATAWLDSLLFDEHFSMNGTPDFSMGKGVHTASPLIIVTFAIPRQIYARSLTTHSDSAGATSSISSGYDTLGLHYILTNPRSMT